jgi:hypothetical protein
MAVPDIAFHLEIPLRDISRHEEDETFCSSKSGERSMLFSACGNNPSGKAHVAFDCDQRHPEGPRYLGISRIALMTHHVLKSRKIERALSFCGMPRSGGFLRLPRNVRPANGKWLSEDRIPAHRLRDEQEPAAHSFNELLESLAPLVPGELVGLRGTRWTGSTTVWSGSWSVLSSPICF